MKCRYKPYYSNSFPILAIGEDCFNEQSDRLFQLDTFLINYNDIKSRVVPPCFII